MPVGTLLSYFCIGISITGIAFTFLAWISIEWNRYRESKRTGKSIPRFEHAKVYLNRWTWLDYYMLLLFLFGFVFLVSDVIGVARQPEVFPSWHFGYVLIGIVVLFHAFLYFLMRYLFLLGLNQDSKGPSHHS